MSKLTRRGLLGAAATGAISLAACAAPEQTGEAEVSIYEGGVAFEHGVASGDPLSDRVILWDAGNADVWFGAHPGQICRFQGWRKQLLKAR